MYLSRCLYDRLLLSSSKLFFHILDFEIKNFSPSLSGVHSQLHISLKIPKKENALTADENERSERNQASKWCSEKSHKSTYKT